MNIIYIFDVRRITIFLGTCNEFLLKLTYFADFLLTLCRQFVASCPDPGIPQNGQRVGSDFGHGKHLQFICDSGYWLLGSQLIVCNEGNWSNEIPKCKGT